VSTIFPEVRLKRYLEMRGADVGGPDHIAALAAFWTGILYDAKALDEAWELVRDWSAEERNAVRAEVPRRALNATVAGRSLRDVARDVLALSRKGLQRRALLDAEGRDETHHLDYADRIVETGRTQAEQLLEKYHGAWGGSVLPAFKECTF
jgi:glutamate--cysteine ligase